MKVKKRAFFASMSGIQIIAVIVSFTWYISNAIWLCS